ncbi:MAG: dihydroorotase family protein [Asgard group archaeon]|nr:dihydroorotase family protein [Asgard group archaeon]
MTVDVSIVNGKIFYKGELRQGGLAIEGEKICKIGKEPVLPKASKKLDAKGGLILPGFIDLHVHLRDFKQQYKETLETGTRAALNGGVTTVLDMPNNIPPTNSAERIILKKKRIENKAGSNVGFYALLPHDGKEITKLVREGIFGFKTYPASPLYYPKNKALLKQLLKKIAPTNLPLLVHPDNPQADELEERLYENENKSAIEIFLDAHNKIDEAKAIRDYCLLSQELDFKLHIVHVTTKESIEVLEKFKKQNSITSEVCPHHLLLNKKDLKKMGSEAKCLPPLRTKEDQYVLWKAIRNDLISIIATDHAPHSFKEKHTSFREASAGIHGLETLLPLMITSVLDGHVSLETLVKKVAIKPAEIARIPRRGDLQEGYFADVVVIQKKKTTIKADNFASKAKWSPFDGFPIKAIPHAVFVNGTLVKEEGYLLSKTNMGKILEPQY